MDVCWPGPAADEPQKTDSYISCVSYRTRALLHARVCKLIDRLHGTVVQLPVSASCMAQLLAGRPRSYTHHVQA